MDRGCSKYDIDKLCQHIWKITSSKEYYMHRTDKGIDGLRVRTLFPYASQ